MRNYQWMYFVSLVVVTLGLLFFVFHLEYVIAQKEYAMVPRLDIEVVTSFLSEDVERDKEYVYVDVLFNNKTNHTFTFSHEEIELKNTKEQTVIPIVNKEIRAEKYHSKRTILSFDVTNFAKEDAYLIVGGKNVGSVLFINSSLEITNN